MNVCIVSTFEGTTEDYMEMFNATKEKGKSNGNDANIRYRKNARNNEF